MNNEKLLQLAAIMMQPALSIILPCYNEEENIGHTVHSVLEWMQQKNIDGEIIVVNDGSTDDSATLLHKLEQEYENVRTVHHETNMGYGIAVRSGLDVATKDIIGFMDSDRQFRVEDFAKLLPHLEQYKFVTGRRTKRADSTLRNVFGKILGLTSWLLLGLWVRDVNCGMKVCKKDIWKSIRPEHSVEKLFNTEMFLNLKKHNIAWKQVSVPHYPRPAGTPTGASMKVILRMFAEYWSLKKAQLSKRH